MRLKIFCLLAAFLLVHSQELPAQSPETVAVLPFQVHGPQKYQYLSQGIQSMLSSRVTRPGKVAALAPGEINAAPIPEPETREQALKAKTALNADYLIYGNVTILDHEAALNVNIASRDREFEPYVRQPELSDLIPALEQVAAELVSDIQGREQASARPEPVARDQDISPPGEEDVFQSPHFKFEDDPQAAGRWRSRTLPFSTRGIAVGTVPGHEQKVIFLLKDTSVQAFKVVDNKLKSITEYQAPLTYQCLNINTHDINNDGSDEILVSAIQDETARSFILGFENDQFELLHKRIPFFLNTAILPPQYREAPVGQKIAPGSRLFRPDSVQMVNMTDSGPKLGRGISLPPKANIFNFAYYPYQDTHLVVISDNDVLKVFDNADRQLYATTEEYSGSSLGIEVHDSMPGLGESKDSDPGYYYIPTRLLPVKFSPRGPYTLLGHRHYAGLSRVFARYRSFPEGEIRALFWDEIGLSVHWHTRKIRANVVDFGVNDIDGDEQPELVVLVNTHPGLTGLQKKRSIILGYKIDPQEMTQEE
ncbi:MAG: hypothetical protein ACOCV7_04170 [Desulfonatronovibrionaceae bacterium]